MKNIVVGSVFLGLLFAAPLVKGGDDVYDEYTPRKEKVKSSQSQQSVASTTQYPTSSAPDHTALSPSFGDNSNTSYFSEDDDNNYASDYSGRIQRFHTPGVSLNDSYGSGSYGGYNNYYDPYSSNTSWYNPGYSQNSWFTPSVYWDYYNFWNPFTTQVVIINQPWQNNWGWCNDPWSNFGWNNNSYNSWNNPWYNPYNSWWTPTCHNIVNNNYGWDNGYKNTIYGPRINTTTNSPNHTNPQKSSGNSNYQYNYTKGTNTGTTINKQQKTIAPQNPNSNNDDSYYKPKTNTNVNNNNPNNSGNTNNNSNSGNNWGTHETESGIKVNKKPK